MKNLTYFLLFLTLLSCHRNTMSDQRAEPAAPTTEESGGYFDDSDGVQGEYEAVEGDNYEVGDMSGAFDMQSNANARMADDKLGKKKEFKTWKRSSKTANMAALFIGDSEELPLKGSQISVKVDGLRARVLIDCFFENDRNSQLEGTFKMKLPQGASPYYFAFGETVYIDKEGKEQELPFLKTDEIAFTEETIEDMRSESWSAPKVARVVAKEKASFAYGQTVRRRVDPALAEWAGADMYNCRVFPLMPNKLHRVVMGYDVNLAAVEADWLFNFPIPELEGPLVVDFDIARLAGVNCVVKPAQDMQITEKRQTFRLTNPTMKEVNITYEDCANMLLRSPHDSDEKDYFAASVLPELPAHSNSGSSTEAIIALDISLSSNPDKFNVWLKLTEAILRNNQATIERFNVLLFNIESFWWKEGWVENTPDQVDRFLAYANTLALEGASDLSHALSAISKPAWANNSSNMIFLLSDGSDTWGESDFYAMTKHIKSTDRLFAYNSGISGTSINNLNHLTKTTGGALFTLASEDELEKVSTAFNSLPWKIESLSISEASDILIAGNPKYLYAGQKLTLAGRGRVSATATVTIALSQNGVKKSLSIPLQPAIESELAPRMYGQMATDILEGFDYVTEKKAVAYAKHFGVPGKTCSLLMLETEEDYKEYNITATEDAYVVHSTTVTEILASVITEIETSLASAKNKFTNWLNKISRMNGVTFDIPASLEILVEKTPEAAFTVNQKSLSTKSRFKSDASKAYTDSLAQPKLDYDQVNVEAQKRLKSFGAHDALKTLSSLVERNPGNTVLARDVAYAALDWGLDEQAYFLFKRVLSSRPYEPQTYLAMAKTLSQIGKEELALLYYEIALQGNWQPRFGEFKRIATLDYLHFLTQLKGNKSFRHADYVQARYQTLQGEMKETSADLMLVISWNTDNTDVDLHVIEPTGEECYYKNQETKIGGHMTADVTQGYGPEMYILQEAKAGKYKVKVKYFSSDRNRTTTRTKVYATIYQNWGKENESVKTQVVSLADKEEMHDILTIEID